MCTGGHWREISGDKFRLSYRHLLGCAKGYDSGQVINEEQAEIVSRINGDLIWSSWEPGLLLHGKFLSHQHNILRKT